MPNDLETAFVVGKRKDGSFFATVDLSNELNIERSATTHDIKYGCSDILDLLKNSEIVTMFVHRLASESQSESERAASSIRQALSEKGIL